MYVDDMCRRYRVSVCVCVFVNIVLFFPLDIISLNSINNLYYDVIIYKSHVSYPDSG